MLALAVLVSFALNARRGVHSERIANPDVTGAPRPVTYLFGVSSQTWAQIGQTGTLIAMVVFAVVCVVAWRRHPQHPLLLMAIAASSLAWLDPVMNWAVYAAYNPQLWHLPEDWPLVSLSPTVEPLIAVGYAYFLIPYAPAIAILRRIQARRPADAWVWRRPLICLAVLIFVIGFIMDIAFEVLLVNQGQYVFSQVVPWGSVFAGTAYQFPLIWQATLVLMVMVPAGVLIYRDDTGRCVAEKLAQRAQVFVCRPVLGTFVVMWAILTAGYLIYGASYWIMRAGGLSTAVACPWPYPEAKVYDPRGNYEKAGAPRPYFAGIWSTWMSGQPHGRPDVAGRPGGGRCASGSQ